MMTKRRHRKVSAISAAISAILLAFGFLAPASAIAVEKSTFETDDPRAFVVAREGQFFLFGKRFVMKGTNYLGSWRTPATMPQGTAGVEIVVPWSLWQNWNVTAINLDFAVLRSGLHATVLRIPLPSRSDFGVWFNPDGSVAERYAAELVQLADLAARNNIRLELCLLWNVGKEIEQQRGAFEPGGAMDRFYQNQVRSIGRLLKRHPSVIAYSVGNEVLVRWQLNGTHNSWYEPFAADFMLRRYNDLRVEAPRQLIATDELVSGAMGTWHTPGADFARLPDVTGSNGGAALVLADHVDYVGAHFYPETLTPQDVARDFDPMIADAVERLKRYMAAVAPRRKPVVFDEFGLLISPLTIPPAQFAGPRDQLMQQVLTAGMAVGLQGLLAWSALPRLPLRSVHISSGTAVENSIPFETNIDARGVMHRVLFYDAYFNLFDLRGDDELVPTAGARAIAEAWPEIPLPLPPEMRR